MQGGLPLLGDLVHRVGRDTETFSPPPLTLLSLIDCQAAGRLDQHVFQEPDESK